MGFGSFGGGGGRILYETVEDDLESWGVELFGDPSRYIAFSAGDNPVCAADAGAQVLSFPRSLRIPAGVTMTPSARCKGLIVYVNGHLRIDGAISMTARGAAAAGVETPLDATIKEIRRVTRTIGKTTQIREELRALAFGAIGTVPAVGGAGGLAVTSDGAGLPGTAGTARKCGGGGSGGRNGYDSGAGGAGTSFSGGAGGGGAAAAGATAGSSAGGGGGAGASAGGGAGNPPGAGGGAGTPGTGGLLLVVVRGNIYVMPGGQITANGAAGNSGTEAGGGGSGGGSINLVYGGVLSNLGTIEAAGGAGGASPGYVGGAGGAGAVTAERLAGLLA